MPELSKIEYKFKLAEIELLASEAVGKNLKIKTFTVKEGGDSRLDIYTKDLVDVIFEEK